MTRAAPEDGFTLIELLVTMVILGIVLGGISILSVSGTRAEADLTSRFEAQTELRVGLDKLRRDVHSACSVTAQTSTSVTFSGPPCDGTNLYTWCTQGSGTRYGLYRNSASSCGGTRFSDFLLGGGIFSYLGPNVTASGTNSYALARLHLDVTVDANPANGAGRYHVLDDVVFRNSARCIAGTNCPP